MTAPPQDQIKKRRNFNSIIVLVGLTIAIVFESNDIIAVILKPLDYFGIQYSPVVVYYPAIVAAIGLLISIRFRRSLIILFLILLPESWVIGLSFDWIERQTVAVHITRFLETPEINTLEQKMGFEIFETGDQSGTRLLVDRTSGRDVLLTSEVKRMGIWRP